MDFVVCSCDTILKPKRCRDSIRSPIFASHGTVHIAISGRLVADPSCHYSALKVLNSLASEGERFWSVLQCVRANDDCVQGLHPPLAINCLNACSQLTGLFVALPWIVPVAAFVPTFSFVRAVLKPTPRIWHGEETKVWAS